MKKNQLQALFFDFDGVLVDSNTIKSEAFQILFRNYDQAVVDQVIAYHQQHGGISRVEKIRHFFSDILHLPVNENLVQQKADEYSRLVVDKVISAPWIAGARSFLELVPDRIPIFVISGTPQNELQMIVNKRKSGHYFREVLGSPIKKPEHIGDLQKRYRLNLHACLFVGDAYTDYHAASLYNMPFLGIQGEYAFPDHVTVLDDCNGLHRAISTHFTM